MHLTSDISGLKPCKWTTTIIQDYYDYTWLSWRRGRRRAKIGILQDIYPWNISHRGTSTVNIANAIFGQTLKHFVVCPWDRHILWSEDSLTGSDSDPKPEDLQTRNLLRGYWHTLVSSDVTSRFDILTFCYSRPFYQQTLYSSFAL